MIAHNDIGTYVKAEDLVETIEDSMPRRKRGPISLREVRLGLGMSQAELRRATGEVTGHMVAMDSISDCENGYPVKELTAMRILTTINAIYRVRGRPELTIDDLTWKISDRRKDEDQQP